ncbi:hypothetical protein MPDQ_004482 [Monascus purpureus]|uniref:Uncharacterized protein n=1 Tax=Monascus purpureus TaxID=5098 RepID=A0A507QXR6_MONPU|nr:hypothetical protein MPDQ_004482 [Monascus purpureus]BDD62725.1 hypothetical protein MAP00_007685 [Monascus purpureus]
MSDQSHQRHQSEDKEGISKYMKRMKTVLRRSSVASGSSSHGDTSGESSKAATRKSSVAPAASPTTTAAATAPAAPTPAPATTVAPAKKNPILVSHWSAIQQEKTRALFAKYGLEYHTADANLPGDNVQRVVKPVRMRVHRTCHRCQTSFGSSKTCVNCQHVCCTKCPRYPAKKSKEDESKAQFKIPTKTNKPAHKHPLTMPSRTGGQDLVRKQIRQKVRRFCHRCNTMFEGQSTECAKCKHTRCKKCPRDPPKLHKYPDGYPGDVEPPKEPQQRVWRKPTRRVRYICHKCSTTYKPGDPKCSNCGQTKGPDTLRDPPKKVKPEPDPEIVKQVEERLAKLRIEK